LSSSWIFQGNPKLYDLVERATSGQDDNWAMNQHRADVRVGDQIYFYLSGADAGIYVVGSVAGPVFDAGPDANFGRWKVAIDYQYLVDTPITRAELLSDPITSNVRVFKGAQGTNFEISNTVAEAIDKLSDNRRSPVEQRVDPLTNSWRDVENMHRAHEGRVREALLDYMHEMDPSAFERLVGLVLVGLGYRDVEVTGRTGDRGIDVTAEYDLHGASSIPTIVQAKRWSGSVGGDTVRELRGAMTVSQRGLLVITSRFTKEALIEANSDGKTPIGLIDGATLVDLMIEHNIGTTQIRLPLTQMDIPSLETI
jgi:restriction endonuclease Mrr